jgi:hypothetical protein
MCEGCLTEGNPEQLTRAIQQVTTRDKRWASGRLAAEDGEGGARADEGRNDDSIGRCRAAGGAADVLGGAGGCAGGYSEGGGGRQKGGGWVEGKDGDEGAAGGRRWAVGSRLQKASARRRRSAREKGLARQGPPPRRHMPPQDRGAAAAGLRRGLRLVCHTAPATHRFNTCKGNCAGCIEAEAVARWPHANSAWLQSRTGRILQWVDKSLYMTSPGQCDEEEGRAARGV